MNLNKFNEEDFYMIKSGITENRGLAPEKIKVVTDIWIFLGSMYCLFLVNFLVQGYTDLIALILTGLTIFSIPTSIFFLLKSMCMKFQTFHYFIFFIDIFLFAILPLQMYKNVLIVGNSIPKLTKTEYLNYFGVFNVFIYLSCVLSLFGGYLYYVKKIKVGDLRENSEFSKKTQIKQKKRNYLSPGIILFLGSIITLVSKNSIHFGGPIFMSVIAILLSLFLLFFIPGLAVPLYCKIRFSGFELPYKRINKKKYKN
ncbi:hypothetical protein [Carnobacterium maltaromaticum]